MKIVYRIHRTTLLLKQCFNFTRMISLKFWKLHFIKQMAGSAEIASVGYAIQK